MDPERRRAHGNNRTGWEPQDLLPRWNLRPRTSDPLRPFCAGEDPRDLLGGGPAPLDRALRSMERHAARGAQVNGNGAALRLVLRPAIDQYMTRWWRVAGLDDESPTR